MNLLDEYAYAAVWEGARAERLLERVEALEDALDEAYDEIRAWRDLAHDLVRDSYRSKDR